MTWFEKLTGFKEQGSEEVQSNIEIKGTTLTSKVNGNSYNYGTLEIPTLEALRTSTPGPETYAEVLQLSEVVGNVQTLHQEPANADALFQAASQFNLLEMVDPGVSPEAGVGIYEHDHTQGPACAIACGAGTIYRNYFAPVNGKIGQSRFNQIDCLAEVGKALNNENTQRWRMENGYALATPNGLSLISEQIAAATDAEYDQIKSKLKVGIQWNTEVTLRQMKHQVTQVYCSALPVSYSPLPADQWEPFARLVLEATYEATLWAALKNYKQTGMRKVFLTLVGGGAFGNKMEWILESLQQALEQFDTTPLKVYMVSYGRSNSAVNHFVRSFRKG